MTPRFSVLMPTHDRPHLIGFAIRSVLAQTRADLELLVVGDGAVDGTAAVVAGFGDPRIRWFDLPKGAGFGYANRNTALLAARGAIVAYAADDDIMLPDQLERLDAAFADPEVMFAYGQALWVSADGIMAPDLTNSASLTSAPASAGPEHHRPRCHGLPRQRLRPARRLARGGAPPAATGTSRSLSISTGRARVHIPVLLCVHLLPSAIGAGTEARALRASGSSPTLYLTYSGRAPGLGPLRRSRACRPASSGADRNPDAFVASPLLRRARPSRRPPRPRPHRYRSPATAPATPPAAGPAAAEGPPPHPGGPMPRYRPSTRGSPPWDDRRPATRLRCPARGRPPPPLAHRRDEWRASETV